MRMYHFCSEQLIRQVAPSEPGMRFEPYLMRTQQRCRQKTLSLWQVILTVMLELRKIVIVVTAALATEHVTLMVNKF